MSSRYVLPTSSNHKADRQDPTTHLVTDFISFYSLPSSIMQSPKYDTLQAAYLFYYASDAVFSPSGSSDDVQRHETKAKGKLSERLNALSQDMLSVAQTVCPPNIQGANE